MINTSESQTQKSTFHQINKYIFTGVPFSLRRLKVPWKDVQTPGFPIIYSLLTFVLPLIAAVLIEFFFPTNQENRIDNIIHVTIGIGIWLWLPFAFNFFQLVWHVITFKIVNFFSNDKIKEYEAAKRATYFSAFYIIWFWSASLLLPYCPKYGIESPGFYLKFISITILFITGSIRIIGVLRAVYLETNGKSWSCLISTLSCIDVLFVFILLLITSNMG